jgi:endonuclease-3
MRKKIKTDKLSVKARKKASKESAKLIDKLEQIYPNAHCELNHKNAWELLIATILSAQCTDKRVNMVTPLLFQVYPDCYKMAEAKQEDVEKIIKSTGFYKNKAKNIIGCSKKLINDFEGRVPEKMEELVMLPGAARKTANVVLWNAFGKNEGIVVDTHVARIAYRLGLTNQKQPAKIEMELMEIIPKRKWGQLSHLLIFLGRDVCKAPKPICGNCKLQSNCPWFAEIVSKEIDQKIYKKSPKTHKI